MHTVGTQHRQGVTMHIIAACSHTASDNAASLRMSCLRMPRACVDLQSESRPVPFPMIYTCRTLCAVFSYRLSFKWPNNWNDMEEADDIQYRTPFAGAPGQQIEWYSYIMRGTSTCLE